MQPKVSQKIPGIGKFEISKIIQGSKSTNIKLKSKEMNINEY